MFTLLLASNNPGKLVEMQDLLAGLPIKLILPTAQGIDLDVVENGRTYLANAALKARGFQRACQQLPESQLKALLPLVILADDSGLEVDALDGAPGLHSARYAPPGQVTRKGKNGESDRRAYLLQQLAKFPPPWTARFHCTIAVATLGVPERPTGHLTADKYPDLYFTEGICPGEIATQERGLNGFGYDPLFYMPDRQCTMAELQEAEKNRISHRGRAIETFINDWKDILT